jgi:hypothetical protein
MMTLKQWVVAAAALAACGLLAGCTKTPEAPEAPEAPAALALPISLLDVMRADVEVPAGGIWAAQGLETLSDDDWLLVDQDAVSLISSASAISQPGTGKDDKAWIANADWQAWAKSMQASALEIRAAAKAKDQTAFSAAADKLTGVCEECHAKYRPQTPSDGVARYPFYPKRVPEKAAAG